MTYFNEEQVKLLLRPIHPRRVLQRDGMSYVEGYDIRAELNRAFGFGRWSAEVLDQAVICEKQVKTKTYTDKRTGEVKGGRDAWYVVYRSRLRLTVHAPDGTELAFYDGSHVGESTHPVLGDAHGNALTNSETYALRRCAINLGDQFGLSLYNKGSMDALVRWTLVRPEAAEKGGTDTDDVPQVSAEDSSSSAGGDDEHITPPRDVSEPELADEAKAARAGLTPEQIRDEALRSATTPERIRELLGLAEDAYPDVVLVNGSGDDERLVDQLKRAIDERTPAVSRPQAAPAPGGEAGESEWVREFYERLAGSGAADIRARRAEVLAAKSAGTVGIGTVNDLLAAITKRKQETDGREAALMSSRPSRLTPAQLLDAIRRRRDGRPDLTVMTSEERRHAGLMDLGQAAEHEHLASIPCDRLAVRVRGPVPDDDIWAAS